MCTNFERSGYEVLNIFDTVRPVSARDAFTQLYNSKTRILLGAQATIDDYVESLHRGRELKIIDNGYILTKLGVMERDRLKKIIDIADVIA